MNKQLTAQTWSPPSVGTRNGNWVWDGSNWICDPDCGNGGGTPPFGPPVFSGPTSQPPWYPGANGGVSFGQTPPSNPIRGHFWWDGMGLWMFDGAAWVGVGGSGAGGGAALGTNPPANPQPGQQWFNGSVLYIWDGNAWVPTSATHSYIQPGAPAAPNPGDTWWDGTVMRIWDGSAWETVGPGALQGPVPTTTITFAMPMPSAISITAGQWLPISWNATAQVDTDGGYDPILHKLTPKRPGIYLCLLRVPIQVTNGQWGGVAILKNDPGSYSGSAGDSVVGVNSFFNGSGPGTLSEWVQCTGVVQINGSTDYLRAYGFSSSGTLNAAGASPAFTVAALP